MSELVIVIIVVALLFDFMNGFHDAANSIATIVGTRVLHPKYAVMWAAFFNFAAFLIFGVHVANTIGKGIVAEHAITVYVILAALIGAIVWDVITWLLALPTSSSHALIGGLIGASVLHGGLEVLYWRKLDTIIAFIFIAPLIGMALGMLNSLAVNWLLRNKNPWKMDKHFRRLQLVSAGLYSLGHGGNDAQKTMGIIAILLFTSGNMKEFHVPLWVALACSATIAIGTLFGGWRIVKTMGMRLTNLKPMGGFCAELSGATTIFLATFLGIPVSTTHTITGAIVGVGSTRRLSAVRWGIAGRIVWAWIFTIPGSALIAAASYGVLHMMGHS